MQRYLLFLCLMLVVSVSCTREPISYGQKYYEKGYCGIATYSWLPEAQRGVAAAQNNMGLIWLEGCPDASIPLNPEEAYNWFILAAQNGEPIAMLNLGDLHKNGVGVEQSTEKAIVWYNLAARQGNRAAQSRLVALGESVPPVDVIAVPTAPQRTNSGNQSSLSQWLRTFSAVFVAGVSTYYLSRANDPSYVIVDQKKEPFRANCFSTVDTSPYSRDSTIRTKCR